MHCTRVTDKCDQFKLNKYKNDMAAYQEVDIEILRLKLDTKILQW